MATSLIIEEQIEIPMDLRSLDDFRRWARSDAFPERGRIDFVAGKIEVDMSPEELYFHGSLKVEVIRVLSDRVKTKDLGLLLTDSSRVSCPEAGLSVEPDVVFVSHEAIDTGQVRLVPKSGGRPGRYVEIEGPVDLVVEIVSDSSVTKDTRRLPHAYAQAGVREFWLADARNEPLIFQIHHLVDQAYRPAEADADAFQRSNVFGCRFRLEGQLDDRGRWRFDLVHSD